ncbi:hypothetical protein KSS87_003588, partial [Heliosperma pusillum]
TPNTRPTKHSTLNIFYNFICQIYVIGIPNTLSILLDLISFGNGYYVYILLDLISYGNGYYPNMH